MAQAAAYPSDRNPLAVQPVGRLLGRYAVPGIVSLLVNSLYNIVDQVFIGRAVGYLGNAATNVVMPMTVVTIALAIMLGDGGAAFMSLNMGRRRRLIATRGCANVITMSVAVGLSLGLLFTAFIQPLCLVFGATPTVLPFATEYGRIIGMGLPFVVVATALNSLLRADGKPHIAMVSMAAGAVVNVGLDALFIFGWGWGMSGAAWATVIGQGLTCGICIVHAARFRSVRLKRSFFRIKWPVARKILAFGTSGFITQIAITLVIVTCNHLIRVYGAQSVYGQDIPLATFGITLKISQVVISIVLGLALGCQPMLGYNYGAGNYARVKEIFRYEVKVGFIITGLATCFFLFAPQALVNLFGSESGLYNEFAVKSFRIFLGLTLLNGFQIGSSMFFQSIGKPLKSAVLSVSRQAVFLIPAAVMLCRAVGVEGILWAGPVADGMACLLAFAFILPEMKKMGRKKGE